jgi:hypothetical protein
MSSPSTAPELAFLSLKFTQKHLIAYLCNKFHTTLHNEPVHVVVTYTPYVTFTLQQGTTILGKSDPMRTWKDLQELFSVFDPYLNVLRKTRSPEIFCNEILEKVKDMKPVVPNILERDTGFFASANYYQPGVVGPPSWMTSIFFHRAHRPPLPPLLMVPKEETNHETITIPKILSIDGTLVTAIHPWLFVHEQTISCFPARREIQRIRVSWGIQFDKSTVYDLLPSPQFQFHLQDKESFFAEESTRLIQENEIQILGPFEYVALFPGGDLRLREVDPILSDEPVTITIRKHAKSTFLDLRKTIHFDYPSHILTTTAVGSFLQPIHDRPKHQDPTNVIWFAKLHLTGTRTTRQLLICDLTTEGGDPPRTIVYRLPKDPTEHHQIVKNGMVTITVPPCGHEGETGEINLGNTIDSTTIEGMKVVLLENNVFPSRYPM